MKALVIAPQPFFSPRGTPFSVYYRTLITAELGVKIDLLTYGDGQDVDIPGVRVIRIPRFRFLGPVRVGPSYLKLYLDFFLVIWSIALLLKKRYDFVHAHEEAVFFCRFLKPIFRFKLLYDMHSSLPEQLKTFKFTRSRFLIGLFNRLERSSLNAADAVITVCPYLLQYVNNIIADHYKTVLVENSLYGLVKTVSKESHSNPGQNFHKFPFEDPVKLPLGKRVVFYAGTLEVYQGIDILISAFSRVVEKVTNAFLLLVGGDEEQVAHYSKMAEKCGLSGKFYLTGRVSQRLTKYYLNLASVLVSPRTQGTNTPMKIYEQIASGIPLVATNIFAHTQVLNDAIAFLVDPEPEDMARGIVRALTSPDDRLRAVKNAVNHYKAHYSCEIYQAKMRELLKLIS